MNELSFSTARRTLGERRGEGAAGMSFWAWGGEGRPRDAPAAWERGDAFVGDPPHEAQGWYSVYAEDASTLAVLRKCVEHFKSAGA